MSLNQVIFRGPFSGTSAKSIDCLNVIKYTCDCLKSSHAGYFDGDPPREHNVSLFSLRKLNKSLRTSPKTNLLISSA